MASLPVPLDVPCPYCHLSYTDMNTFNQHINFHLKKIEERADFPCGYCEKRLLSAFGLEHHVRNKHPDVTIQWSSSLNPDCELTTESAATKSPPVVSDSPEASPASEDENKDDHSDSDESDSDRDISESSEIDDAEWSSPATPWVEVVVIGDQKMYSCIICQKQSPKLSRLQEHVRLHTGERPYECFVCQDKFRRSQSFKQHFQRFHSNFRVDMKLELVPSKLKQNTAPPKLSQAQVTPPHATEEDPLLAQSVTATKSLSDQGPHTELESKCQDCNLGENLQGGQGHFGEGNGSFRTEEAYDTDVVQLLADMGVGEVENIPGPGSQLSVPKCMLSPTEELFVNSRSVSTLSVTANDLNESLNLMRINPPSDHMMSYSLTPPQSPAKSRNTINSQTSHSDLNKYLTRSRNYSISSPRYVCPDCYIGCVDLDEYFKHTAACEVVQSSLPQLSIMDRIARENKPKPTESPVIIDDKMQDVAEPASGQIGSAVPVESPHLTNLTVQRVAQYVTEQPCSSSSDFEKTLPGASATTATPPFAASLAASPLAIAPPPKNTPSPTKTRAKTVSPQIQSSPCMPSATFSDSPKSVSDITSPKQLGRHRKPRGLLPCPHCPRWYDNPSALRTHMYATHGEALFELEAEAKERHATMLPLQSTLTAIVNPFSHLRLDSAQEPGSTSPKNQEGTPGFQTPSLSHPKTCKAEDILEIVSPTQKIETHLISKIQEPHPPNLQTRSQLHSPSVPCRPKREKARASDQQSNNSASRQLFSQQGPVPASDIQGAENKRVTRKTMLSTPTPSIDYQQRLRKRKQAELKEEEPIPCKYCKRKIPQWKMEKHEKMHVEKQINQNQVKKMALKRKLSQVFEWDGRSSPGPGNQYTETRYAIPLEYASVCPTPEVWTSLSPRTVNKALATLLKK